MTEKYENAFDPLVGSNLFKTVINQILHSSLNTSIFGKIVNRYVKTILSTNWLNTGCNNLTYNSSLLLKVVSGRLYSLIASSWI